MFDLDAQTVLNLTGALARHLAADYARRFDLPSGGPYWAQVEAQLTSSLAPGVVAFLGRLSTAIAPDFDLLPVLTRFFDAPATAAALNRYGTGEPDGGQAVADALLAAGLDPDALDRSDFEAALDAWVAASAEVARRAALTNTNYQQAAQLYQQTPARPLGPLGEAMAVLVNDLARDGLSRIVDGEILAADGTTILFSWRRQSAGRDDYAESVGPEEPAAAEPQTAGEGGPETIGEVAGEPLPEPPPPPPPPLEPSPPPPAPQPPTPAAVVPLRLDAAAPPQVTVGLSFDLLVAVRRTDSPPLSAPADLSLRDSAPFAAVMPAGALFLALRIQVAAPDCDIHGGDTRPVRLLPGQDGPTVYFQLTPRRPGPLSLVITVYQETDWIGSTRLRTEAGAGGGAAAVAALSTAAPRAGLVMTTVSQPLAESEVNLKTLRDALDNGYSDGELRDLCLELNLDYEDLPGDGQAAKARELVLYCKRRGLLAALVERVMRDRPHLLVN